MADGQVVFEISADPTKAKNAISQTTAALERAGKEWEHVAEKSTAEVGDTFETVSQEAKKAIDDTTAEFEKAGKDWKDAADDSTTKIGGSFADMFKKIGIAAAAAKIGKFFLDFGKAAVDAASDLEEVQNVVDVTFGDGASQIQAWANTARTQFGLTEIQAKKFTSTLGAMMKSAGLAGPEIVSMSTDLAGLAADMASFYNLDFETAFQKIRSGISGETEPLKQLGINMSVANLEAYALSKGIETAFDKMSQSEQTMLRYQYLMQATADAQGDFARTSDSYANTIRSIETSFESIKTSVGTVLLPAVQEAVGYIDDLIKKMMPDEDFHTVLDEFNAIQLDTDQKLEDIATTKAEAELLIGVLEDINNTNVPDDRAQQFLENIASALDDVNTSVSTANRQKSVATIQDLINAFNSDVETVGMATAWENLLGGLSENIGALADVTGKDSTDIENWLTGVANAADEINMDSVSGWGELLPLLQEGIPGLEIGDGFILDATQISKLQDSSGAINDMTASIKEASKVNYSKTLTEIFTAFDNDVAQGDNAKAWDTLLASLSTNIDALADLTGKSPDDITNWLTQMGEAANTLDPNSADGWATLMSMLIQGIPGLTLDEEGNLDTSALQNAGEKANQYSQYLASLGIATDDVADSQQVWLDICRRLVQVIPGLGNIINMETGEIEGGTDALRQYVKEWEDTQTKMVLLNDIQRRRQALSDQYGDRYSLQAEMLVQQARAQRLREEYERRLAEAGLTQSDINSYQVNLANAANNPIGVFTSYLNSDKTLANLYDFWIQDIGEADKAAEEAEANYEKYMADYEAATAMLMEQEDAVIEKYGEEALAIDEVAVATQNLTKEGEELAAETMQNLAPALEELADYYGDVYNATQRQVDGIIGGFEKIQTPAQKAREEFRKLNNELSDEEFEIRFAAEGNVPSAQSMLAGLESQAEYIRQYQEYLEAARAAGVNEDLLAELSDGSTESYDYLAALADASEEQIQAINDAYADVSSGKETFVDALTQQKLAADETFQAIVDSCDQMIIDLDMADGAYDSLSSTVEGMANGIADKLPDLTAQVDAVIAQLSRLNSTGRFGMVGDRFTFGASGRILDGSFAGGADYIPFDGFLAQLHEGESVLPAEEARVWRTFKYGAAASSNNIDYDALGSTIGANVHAGGSVYLDGAVVGRVISQGQANSYRQLERSGWQK